MPYAAGEVVFVTRRTSNGSAIFVLPEIPEPPAGRTHEVSPLNPGGLTGTLQGCSWFSPSARPCAGWSGAHGPSEQVCELFRCGQALEACVARPLHGTARRVPIGDWVLQGLRLPREDQPVLSFLPVGLDPVHRRVVRHRRDRVG